MNRKGFLLYAIKLQNEPQNSQASYPTMLLPVSQAAAVGVALRALLDSNGFSGVKIIGYDHNWNNAATYPVQLMQQAGGAFTGVAFHCYEGTVSQQLDVSLRDATFPIYMNSPAPLVLQRISQQGDILHRMYWVVGYGLVG
jgi:O-glycosyl hydrolase